VDQALAGVAVDLNEEAKAKRRGRKPDLTEALNAGRAHLGTGQLQPGERWHEGELLEGFSYDEDGYVVDEDGTRTGARRRPPEGEESLVDALTSLGSSVNAADTGTDGLDLSEGAHTLAIDRMEAMATEAVITDRNLIAFARDFLLDQIKARPKPWSATSPGEQRDVAAAAEHAAQELVRKIAEAIATGGRSSVRVLLTKVTLGDDIVIAGKVKTLDHEDEDRAVVALHGARGKHVMVIAASADDYRGGPEAQTDVEEPGLDFEAGSDADDNDD
jgi:hypothetical protein